MIRKGIIGFILICTALVILGCNVILLTSSGLRFCIIAAEKLSPGKLTVGAVHGRLLNSFELEDISYSDSFVRVRLQDVSLSWRPYELLHKKFFVTSFRATDVFVEMLSQAESSTSPDEPGGTAGDFVLPLAVHLQKGFIGPITIITEDDQEKTEFQSMDLEDLSGQEDLLRFGKWAVASETWQLAANGEIRFADIPSTDMAVDFSTKFAGMASMAGEIALAGTLERLGYEILLVSPSPAKMGGFLYDIVENFHWDGLLFADELVLDELSNDWPGFSFKALKIAGEGDASSYSTIVEGSASYDKLKDILVAGNIKGDSNGLQFEKIRLEKDETRLLGDGTLSWQDGLAWQLSMTGKEVNLGMLDPALAGSFGLTAEIDGNENDLQFKKFMLDKEEARMTGDGTLSWQNGLAWQLNLTGNDIDPGVFDPQWPGRLDFNAITSGRETNGNLQTDVDLQELDGELRGVPLNASGKIGIDADRISIEKVYIQSADSILRVDGSSGESMDMQFSLNSPDLGTVWPNLFGSLSVNGNLKGSWAKPDVDFEISARGVQYKETGIKSLTGFGKGVLEAGGSVDVSLAADDVIIGDNAFDSVALDIQGELQKHLLELSLTAPGESASLRLEGGYADKRWNGFVSRGIFQSDKTGTWRLRDSAALQLSQTEIDIGKVCLAGEASAIVCLNGSYSTDDWNVNATVDSFPFKTFEKMQGSLEEMDGVFSGTLTVRGKGVGIENGELKLATDGFSSRFALAEDVTQFLVVKRSTIHINTDGTDFNIQMQGIMEDESSIRVDGILNGINIIPLDTSNAGFTGSIALNIIDLSVLEALIYPRAELFGRLVGTIDVRGKLKQPELSGTVLLDKGRIIFPEQGITVENLTLQMEGLVDRLRVSLTGTSGGGSIRAAGFLPLSLDENETVTLHVSGDKFKVMNSPEIQVSISPDLQLKISGSKKEIIGRILVAEALFSPISMQGVVSPSDDVVFVHGDEDDAKAALPFHADLLIVAGEKVLVRAFGLKGLIGGQLHIVSEPSRPVVLEGNLDVREGTYSVYGRQLNIVRGYLLYSGNPPDNPGIDIRAENTASGVTTGIEVSGFLQEPEIGLYSTPAMEKDEIIRRLLLNTSLVGSSEDEGFLESVTSDTGIDPVTSAVVGVKEGLRLDDIKIESGKESEDVSLVVGSWLTPKLYVSYGQNLLKQSGSFNTKYLLGYGFSVETESGATDNGVDLMYEIDKW